MFGKSIFAIITGTTIMIGSCEATSISTPIEPKLQTGENRLHALTGSSLTEFNKVRECFNNEIANNRIPEELKESWDYAFEVADKLLQPLCSGQISYGDFNKLIEITNNGFYALTEIIIQYHSNESAIHKLLDDFWQVLWQIRDICCLQMVLSNDSKINDYEFPIVYSSNSWKDFVKKDLLTQRDIDDAIGAVTSSLMPRF